MLREVIIIQNHQAKELKPWNWLLSPCLKHRNLELQGVENIPWGTLAVAIKYVRSNLFETKMQFQEVFEKIANYMTTNCWQPNTNWKLCSPLTLTLRVVQLFATTSQLAISSKVSWTLTDLGMEKRMSHTCFGDPIPNAPKKKGFQFTVDIWLWNW